MEISRARLLFSLGLGVLAVSFASILIRLAGAGGVPPLSIAAWRLIVAAVVLLPHAWLTRRSEFHSLSRRDVGLLAIAGLFLALHFASWIASLSYTTVASAAVLGTMAPVFVALGSWLLMGESPTALLSLGIVLAAVGSITISWGDLGHGQERLWGDLLALIGGAMVAGYLIIGRRVRGRLSLSTYAALVYGLAALVLATTVLVTGQPMLGFDWTAYVWLLALGLGPQVVGHSTLNWALRYLSATFVSIVILAEPVGASILAYLILGEQVTALTFLGALMVLTGIYMASRAELAAAGRET